MYLTYARFTQSNSEYNPRCIKSIFQSNKQEQNNIYLCQFESVSPQVPEVQLIKMDGPN